MREIEFKDKFGMELKVGDYFTYADRYSGVNIGKVTKAVTELRDGASPRTTMMAVGSRRLRRWDSESRSMKPAEFYRTGMFRIQKPEGYMRVDGRALPDELAKVLG